jgi:hypothetical protein
VTTRLCAFSVKCWSREVKLIHRETRGIYGRSVRVGRDDDRGGVTDFRMYLVVIMIIRLIHSTAFENKGRDTLCESTLDTSCVHMHVHDTSVLIPSRKIFVVLPRFIASGSFVRYFITCTGTKASSVTCTLVHIDRRHRIGTSLRSLESSRLPRTLVETNYKI